MSVKLCTSCTVAQTATSTWSPGVAQSGWQGPRLGKTSVQPFPTEAQPATATQPTATQLRGAAFTLGSNQAT